MKIIIILLGMLLLSACSDEDAHSNSDRKIDYEALVSISEGVYGVVTHVDDLKLSEIRVLKDFKIHIFPGSFEDKNFSISVPLVSAITAGNGFYEIPLQPGNYCICTDFGRCSGLFLGDDDLLRMDYEMSVGPGWPTVVSCN